MAHIGDIMKKIEKESNQLKEMKKEKNVENHHYSGLENQYHLAKKEKSHQKSLSVELAEHLLNLSKKVVQDDITPSTVNAACNCATQITNLIKINMRQI